MDYNEMCINNHILYDKGIEFFKENNIKISQVKILFYYVDSSLTDHNIYFCFKYKNYIYYAYIGGKWKTGHIEKKVKLLDFLKYII